MLLSRGAWLTEIKLRAVFDRKPEALIPGRFQIVLGRKVQDLQ